MNDLYNEFEKFYQSDLTNIIKEKIKAYMDSCFMRGRSGDESNGKDLRLYGWIGFALKSNEIPEPVRKYNPKNTKIVLQKNNKGDIIKEYPALYMLVDFLAERGLKNSRTVVCTMISRREQILIDDIHYYFEYK